MINQAVFLKAGMINYVVPGVPGAILISLASFHGIIPAGP